MPAPLVRLVTLVLVPLALSPVLRADGPSYSAASIVNSASFQDVPLAPNAIGTVFGTNLSYVTASLTSGDVNGGQLPNVLPGTGVNVLIGGLAANIFYVSPTQINFLVPSILLPGKSDFQIVHDGLAGPDITIQLASSSPAIYQLDSQTVIATRPDGTLITPDAPASPGDIVTLYATGLGDTVPPVDYSFIAPKAAALKQLAQFGVMFDGAAVDPSQILYAGIAPGFAGLYQINVRIPATANANPQLQIGLGAAASPPGLIIPLSLPAGSQ